MKLAVKTRNELRYYQPPMLVTHGSSVWGFGIAIHIPSLWGNVGSSVDWFINELNLSCRSMHNGYSIQRLRHTEYAYYITRPTS